MRAVSLLLVAPVLCIHAVEEESRRDPKRSCRFRREDEAAGKHSVLAEADVLDAGEFGCLGGEVKGSMYRGTEAVALSSLLQLLTINVINWWQN